MKRILSLLITLVCVAGFIYGCAAVSSSSIPSRSTPSEASLPEEKAPTLLLCLPRDGEDHSLLRDTFTAQAQAAGYEAYISEPAADNNLTDEQIWDVDQLQHQADAVIIYNCDGVEEGLVKKWSDAGVIIVAAGKRLDGQIPVENSMPRGHSPKPLPRISTIPSPPKRPRPASLPYLATPTPNWNFSISLRPI